MKKIKEFIVDYIQREYTVPEGIDIMNLNYVEEGYIDSLGLFQFIAVIEDEFDIVFTEEDLASSDIKIVGKIVNLVAEKMKVQK